MNPGLVLTSYPVRDRHGHIEELRFAQRNGKALNLWYSACAEAAVVTHKIKKPGGTVFYQSGSLITLIGSYSDHRCELPKNMTNPTETTARAAMTIKSSIGRL